MMDNGDSNPQDPMHDLRYTISESYQEIVALAKRLGIPDKDIPAIPPEMLSNRWDTTTRLAFIITYTDVRVFLIKVFDEAASIMNPKEKLLEKALRLKPRLEDLEVRFHIAFIADVGVAIFEKGAAWTQGKPKDGVSLVGMKLMCTHAEDHGVVAQLLVDHDAFQRAVQRLKPLWMSAGRHWRMLASASTVTSFQAL